MARILVLVAGLLSGLFRRLRKGIRRFDASMRLQYRPSYLALAGIMIIAALMVVMLLTPPYLGLSNDGSFDNVLIDCGLVRLDPDDTSAYYNYYERLYRIQPTAPVPDVTPLPQRVMVRLAVLLDVMATGDDIFDLRTLAALYMLLYLGALYPLLWAMLDRVKVYSEGLALLALCVLVYADVTVVTRFASLYTYPLELLLFLVIADALFMLPRRMGAGLAPAVLLAATCLLMLTNRYCALAGVVISLCYWRLVGVKAVAARRLLYIVCALALCIASIAAAMHMTEQQTAVSKYNQMTRGVLFQAENPEKALAEFGIEPRYALLAKTYGDQEFPVALPDDGVLDEGFLDRYGTRDVLLYYLRHPSALVGLLNEGIQRAFITRTDYSGNYEQSVGLPPRAKSPFMALWSTFKEQFAPRSIAGVLVLILTIALLRLNRRDVPEKERERESLFRDMWRILILLGTVNLCTVVIMSGDSELLNESFLMSALIDLLVVMFIAEILHRLKIISPEE